MEKLFIGLNGYAGSGKDTVAKMLFCILGQNWENKNDCFKYYIEHFSTGKNPYATYPHTTNSSSNDKCICIAFADRLKQICASMFGIPVERFYYNKSNSWICINKDFKYTEHKPADANIITARDYKFGFDNYTTSGEDYWMSLREILVYVGTYICQDSINVRTFVNSVKNTVLTKSIETPSLEYIICTDVRFVHEYNYIKDNSGIMINIERPNLVQLDDIAEHSLDAYTNGYDFVISNSGSYEELFDKVWDMVSNNVVFKNNIIQLYSRDSSRVYLREVDNNTIYELCMENPIYRISYDNSGVCAVDPIGGPYIGIDQVINNKIVKNIHNTDNSKILITLIDKN